MDRVWVQLTHHWVRIPGHRLEMTDYAVTPHVAGGFHNRTRTCRRRTLGFRGRVGVVTHVPTGLRCSGPLPWTEALRQAGWWVIWGPRRLTTRTAASVWALTHPDVYALLETGLNPGMLFERPEQPAHPGGRATLQRMVEP